MARQEIEKHLNSDCNSEEAYPLIVKLYSLKQVPRKLIVYTSKYGHSDWVNRLLHSGWSAHIQDDKALWDAFRNGHLSVAEFLLEVGADFTRKPQPPLIQAINQNQIEILQLLVSRGARFNFTNIYDAACISNVQTFKLLLNNSQYNYPNDLLIYLKVAVIYSNQEVIKYLNSLGIKILERDKPYYSPAIGLLQRDYIRSNVDTFQLLMDLGYEFNHIAQLMRNFDDSELKDFILDLETQHID